MDPRDGLLLLVLVALVVVIWRLHRLEQLLTSGARRRRPGPGSGSGSGHKVVPILKDHLEPGPFKRPDDET